MTGTHQDVRDRRSRLFVLMATLAVLGLLSMGTPAHAHTDGAQDMRGVGRHQPRHADCMTGTSRGVIVAAPVMYAAGTNWITEQQVAWRPHLARWNGHQWVHVASGRWAFSRATSTLPAGPKWYYRDASGRYNDDTAGAQPIQVSSGGYYRVYDEYYWYSYHWSTHPGHHVQWMATHRTGSHSYSYCWL